MRKLNIGVMLIIAAVVALGVQLPGLAGTVDAAKPAPVLEFSNGFPSGPHLTLNIHGKDASFATDPLSACNDGIPGGGSIFIGKGTTTEPAYSEILLKAKPGLTELTALDECSFAASGDPALVEMPSGIEY